MASDNEASCESDPNFAVICAFMEKFGATCGLASIDFLELQEMLENTQEVPQELIDLHIKLLRKSRKTVSNERWEKAVIKFCHSFCVQDAWEIERFGYKKARLSSKLRVLKELLEMQFDYNARFKAEINKMSAEELRSQPLGKDKHGHAYWFQNDNNCQIRVYKEDPDEETWTLVAKDREGLVALIGELSNGDAVVGEAAINEEDSNSLMEKPIIDTGQVDSSSSDSNNKKSVDESDNSSESKKEENISPSEEEPEEEEEDEDEEKKRPRENDDREEEEEEERDAKRPKMEVGEAVEEPVMLVKGLGSGAENECDNNNPIVGEEIEEDLMYFYGSGDGVECETGNEDETKKAEGETLSGGDGDKDSAGVSSENYVSISVNKGDSKNCIGEDGVDGAGPRQVPTSPVKSPFKLGTIIDTKTDNKFFNAATRTPTKKTSRWDVETIMAKEPLPPPEEAAAATMTPPPPPPKKSMFFFGPGCMQFKATVSPVPCSATVAFGQKVPQSEDEGVVQEDVGYRIVGEEISSECVQSSATAAAVGPGSNDDRLSSSADKVAEGGEGSVVDDRQTPLLESRISDKLEDIDETNEETKAEKNPQDVEVVVDGKSEIEEKEEDVSESKIDSEAEKEETNTVVKDEPSVRELTQKLTEEPREKDKEEDIMNEESTEQVITEEVKKEESTEQVLIEKVEKEGSAEQVITEEVKKEESMEQAPEKVEKEESTEEVEKEEKMDKENEVNIREKSEESKKEESKENLKEENEEIHKEEKGKNPPELEKEEDMPEVVKEEDIPEVEKEDSPPRTVMVDKNENISTEEPEKPDEGDKNEPIKEQETLTNLEKEIVTETDICDDKTEVQQKIPEVTAALIEYKKENEVRQTEETKETDPTKDDTNREEEHKEEEEEEEETPPPLVPVIEEECVKKHSYTLGEETEKKMEETKTEEKLDEIEAEPVEENNIEESAPPKEEIPEDTTPHDIPEEKPIIPEETTKDNQQQMEEKLNCSAAKEEPVTETQETVISTVKNEVDTKKEVVEEEKEETKPLEESIVEVVKKQDEEQAPKDTTTNNNNKSVRGRKNNVSDQPKVIFTRRTTRSSKSDETKLPDEPTDLSIVKDEKKPDEVVQVQPRRGRSRGMTKVEKEEVQEADGSKKIKLSEEVQEEIETKPTRPTKNKLKEKKTDEEVREEAEAEASPEVVNVESGNSSDVVDAPDKDPLAVEEETTSAAFKEEEEIKKPMSLATFSLDFHESPLPTPPLPTPPLTRSGLRKRGRESPPNAEEAEETAGKRLKKGKRNIDVKLRKSIEEQKKQELISSDDDKQQQSEETASAAVVVATTTTTTTATTVTKHSRKKGKHKKVDQVKVVDEATTTTVVVVSSDPEAETQKETEPAQKKTKTVNKNKRLLSNLGINPDQPLEFEMETTVGVRQSRRIAQLKIKEEAERRKLEEEMAQEQQHHQKKKKSKKSEDKEFKIKKSKNEAEDDDDVQEEDSADSKKRKKKKKKKHKKLFDEFNPWRSSSDSSTSDDEEDEDEICEEEDDEVLQYVSDHEFSPESDLEADGEAQPLKRARTARKESDVEEVDDCPCQKCGKSDHPEWILLCDRCDNGWHCSCLRPPLLVIPEGDWFCPPCQHSTLLKKLQDKLKDYDKKLSKKEIEDRRKQRLAYVGISLNSVLPTKEAEAVKKRRPSNKDDDDEDGDDDEPEDEEAADDEEDEDEDDEESEESGSGSGSGSGSESDEPIYQLRQRRQAHSYRFNDYDELINSAIQEEMEAVKGAGNQGRGKDIATIVNAEKEEERKKETGENGGTETGAVEEAATAPTAAAAELPEPLPPVVPPDEKDREAKPLYSDDEPIRGVPKKKIIGRKKHRKLNSLDISSADDDEDSDEDFKGTSTESDDDFDEDLGSEDSEDLDSGRGGRRRNADPVRRSTRARTSRYDADFIDDGDSEDEDEAPRRKKKRSIWDDSESEESDRSWGRRKRKPPANRKKNAANQLTVGSKKKKSKKKKKKNDDSDAEVYRKKKPKIKFGLDGEDEGPGRRTRGKKINYVDALGSDSDEDRVKRPPPRIESEEEYVANEEEELDEDDKVTDEEESTEENNHKPPPAPPAAKVQIQSYADARFTQLLPEGVPTPTPKDLYVNNQVLRAGADDDGEDEPNPIDQINRNVEMMDENEMEKMMEEEEYANKQLQMVAVQLEKEKRRKEREAAKKLEGLMAVQATLSPQQDPKKRLMPVAAKKLPPVKGQFQFSGSMQEPIVGNVDSLIVNAENNDELSEPPGVSLPLFAELAGAGAGGENLEDSAKKRRGRNKKSLEEAVANLGSVRQQQESGAFMALSAASAAAAAANNKNLPTDLSSTQDSNIEIAAPPQPFSQSQPTPSVITRMLQNKPGQPGYPVGTIRPKQFATMPDREDEVPSPTSVPPPPASHHSMSPAPAHHGQYMQAAPMRAQLTSPYRQLPPAMNHYPRVSAAPPPPHPIRTAQPLPSHLYHSHRPMDPSPSGGGAISMADHHNSPGRVVSPASGSPGGGAGSNKNDTPPPPYSRPPPVTRFPMINTTSVVAGPPRHIPMVAPQHLQPPRSNLSPYHPSMPPSYHYGQFGAQGLGGGEEAMPPTVYQNSPYSEQFVAATGEGHVNASENSNNSKSFDEESGGEFGGLVSYFSSQREDDLES